MFGAFLTVPFVGNDGNNVVQGVTGPTGGLFIPPTWDPHINNAVWFKLVAGLDYTNTFYDGPAPGSTGATGGGAQLQGTLTISAG